MTCKFKIRHIDKRLIDHGLCLAILSRVGKTNKNSRVGGYKLPNLGWRYSLGDVSKAA